MSNKSTANVQKEGGRVNQKARTRAALVDAARALFADGRMVTIAEVADRARVSRASAYRYFPSQEALLVELASEPVWAPIEKLQAQMRSDDVEKRLLSLIDAVGRVLATEEAHMRMALRVYHDTWLRGHRNGADAIPALRQGRRMRWLDKVLEPLPAIPDDKRQQLRAALALAVGADSFTILKDVCQLSNDEAFSVLRWAAIALLRAALEQTNHPSTAFDGRRAKRYRDAKPR
jgi:AcrR family transcriptional regulator